MSMLRTEERNGRRYLIDVNPATLEVNDEIKMLNEDEVKKVVDKAEKSFDKWSSISFDDRAAFLLKVKNILLEDLDEVAVTITRDMGKPKVEAVIADIMVALDIISLYSKRGKKISQEYEIPLHLFKFIKKSKIAPRPYGVISVISPWNYPFAIPMSGIVFALLAGNTVVHKPASDTALVGLKIQNLFDKAGLPEGVMNTVITPGAVAEKVLCAPPVRKVIFTGSTDIGKRILKRCADNIIPVVAELGGKDPMIVLEDVDIEYTSNAAVWAAFTNCGQVCASLERLYVHKKIADDLIARVVEKTKELRIGNGEDPTTDVGPLVSESQLQTVMDHVNDAVAHGAKVLVGGKRREDLKGYFYEPTVLVNVNHSLKCIREETFGPTLPIMTFETDDEAIELANDTIYGLTASVFTKDKERGERIAKKVWAGSVLVNDHADSYGLVETPWQGVKESGLGRSHSDDGFREFLYPQHICIDNIPFGKRRPWWYPYSEEVYKVFKYAQNAVFGSGVIPKASNLYQIVKGLITDPNMRKSMKF